MLTTREISGVGEAVWFSARRLSLHVIASHLLAKNSPFHRHSKLCPLGLSRGAAFSTNFWPDIKMELEDAGFFAENPRSVPYESVEL